MGQGHTSRWEGDDLDPSGDPSVPLRAKPIGRRVPTRWREEEGVFRAAIGRWAVRVAESPGPSRGWEWSAFAAGGRPPRALRCTGWIDREAAQRDAEKILG
jgi:hypothetical protein